MHSLAVLYSPNACSGALLGQLYNGYHSGWLDGVDIA